MSGLRRGLLLAAVSFLLSWGAYSVVHGWAIEHHLHVVTSEDGG